jgi:uncharacterized protein (UPF0332 family)
VTKGCRLGEISKLPSAKAYYAMFYAAQALLKAHDIKVVNRSEVASLLCRHFAKTGRFDPKFHRMFLNARVHI